MNEIQPFNIFSVPLWKSKYFPNEEYFNECTFFVNELRKTNFSGVKKSNIGGWQSPAVNLQEAVNSPFASFFAFLETIIPKINNDIGTSRTFTFGNTWVNINSKSDSNSPHVHPNSVLSGVFYLTDDNSDIVFYREDPLHYWYMSCLGSRNNTEYSANEYVIRPVKGDVL